jgi:hypothetical protein
MYQAKFQALEQIIHRQQKTLDSSGKVTSDRLTNIEQQLSRIDDLDSKLSAVRSQLHQAAEHQQTVTSSISEITKQNRDTQRQAKEHQLQSDQKIDTLGNTVVKVMTSLIEIRTQFEQMSIFMQQIANKRDQSAGSTGKRDRPQTSSQEKVNSSIPSQLPLSSQASTSSESRISDTSSQSTTCLHSPRKKKQHSTSDTAKQKEEDDSSQTSSAHDMTVDEESSQSSFPNGHRNLELSLLATEGTITTNDSHGAPSPLPPATQPSPSPQEHTAPDTSHRDGTQQQSSSTAAPLNPQYKSMGSDGAHTK